MVIHETKLQTSFTFEIECKKNLQSYFDLQRQYKLDIERGEVISLALLNDGLVLLGTDVESITSLKPVHLV